MTLRDWEKKKEYYHHEYDYFTWNCACYGDKEAEEKRDYYYSKWEKMKRFEKQILENALKIVDKYEF